MRTQLDDAGLRHAAPGTRHIGQSCQQGAGDCANGGREVVNAVAEGKKAARAMHAWFGGEKVTGAIQPSRYGVKGAPMGSGFDRPIRVPELEDEYAKQNKK